MRTLDPLGQTIKERFQWLANAYNKANPKKSHDEVHKFYLTLVKQYGMQYQKMLENVREEDLINVLYMYIDSFNSWDLMLAETSMYAPSNLKAAIVRFVNEAKAELEKVLNKNNIE